MIGVGVSKRTALISMALAILLAILLALICLGSGEAYAYPAGWTADNEVVASGVQNGQCDIYCYDNYVHLVYKATDDIWYMRSTDRGATWEDPVRIDLDSKGDFHPAVMSTGYTGDVYIAYSTTDVGFPYRQICVRRSDDFGATWIAGYHANTTAGMNHYNPSMVRVPGGGTGAIVYSREELDGYNEVYIRSLGDFGWGTQELVSTDDTTRGRYPAVASTGTGEWWVVWQEQIFGGYEIYHRRKTAGAWQAIVNLSGGCPEQGQCYPDIAWLNSEPYLNVVWAAYPAAGGSEVYRRRYIQGSGGWLGAAEHLYTAPSTGTYPMVSPVTNDVFCRAEGGANVMAVTTGDDTKVMEAATPYASRSVRTHSASAYTYLAVACTDGRLLLKRQDDVAPDGDTFVDGVQSETDSDPVYFNSDFTLSYENVVDDFGPGVTGTDPLGDSYTDGVSSIALKYAPHYNDPPVGWTDLPCDGGSVINNAPWSATVTAGHIPDGSYYIKGTISDCAHNTTDVFSGRVIIDTTKPDCDIALAGTEGDNGWYTSNVKVTLSSTDPNVNAIQYQVADNGGSSGGANWTTYKDPFKVGEGRWEIKARATDKAGNTGDTRTDTVSVDSIGPSCAIERPDRDFIETGFEDGQEYRLTGVSTDSNGVDWAAFYIDGSEVYSTRDNFDMAYVWKLPGIKDAGTYEIKVRARDRAGNYGETSKNVVIDNFCRDWYFAEGNTLPEFDEFICLANPGDRSADVVIGFHLEVGGVIVKNFSLPAHSRETVVVKDHIPEGNHVSAHVHCDTQAIIAERPMYFNYRGKWAGGHNEKGINAPQKNWYFAEGTTRKNSTDGEFEEWICLQNPGDATATVKITYMTGTGDNIIKHYQVGPYSRKTVDVYLDVGLDQDVSTMIESDVPICSERPQYSNYHQFAPGGHVVSGVSSPLSEWYFAEGSTRQGFQEWVTIQNPNTVPAKIKMRYMTSGEGSETGSVIESEREVAPRSRDTVKVADDVGDNRDVSIELVSDVPVVAERPMYFSYGEGAWTGGHDVMGVSRAATEYYLAEGTTRDGYDTWFTIQNPGDNVTNVQIDLMYPDGKVQTKTLYVNPHTRVTISVDDMVDGPCDVAATIKAGSPIVVERPIYFDYHGWTGGHNTSGYGID